MFARILANGRKGARGFPRLQIPPLFVFLHTPPLKGVGVCQKKRATGGRRATAPPRANSSRLSRRNFSRDVILPRAPFLYTLLYTPFNG